MTDKKLWGASAAPIASKATLTPPLVAFLNPTAQDKPEPTHDELVILLLSPIRPPSGS